MEPFAIVGFSFKMPQDAIDESSFWEVLENRKSLMTEWPENRASIESFFDRGSKNLNTLPARGAHFLKEDPGVFDAPFFSITASEAAAMDPQQRWALEVSYHAFENAGIPLERLRGSQTAVFGASFTDDYGRIMVKDPDTTPRQAITGITPSMLPNRVSWYFHLRGPSVHVDTACSSSMTALDMACQSMRSGDATAALVVGSNMLLSPELSLYLSNMNFLSPDSRCFSFDARANGYARGEGVVALVLKPVANALRDGNVIRAIIRATASNHDSRTPILTQPSAEAQEALIRHTYAKAGLDLGETRYFEAHGTGTAAGDPIEMTAIGRVFRTTRSSEEPLFVGSVKANIGHLEGASGLAGIIKSILVLEKGIIPPNALFESINPDIDEEFYNIKVATQSTPWPKTGLRRISINSFGIGGANSHVILDDAFHYLQTHGLIGHHHCADVSTLASPVSISVVTDPNSDGYDYGNCNGVSEIHDYPPVPKLLVFSASDPGAIQRMVSDYENYFQSRIAGHSQKLAQFAYTLAARRSIMPWRTFALMDATYGIVGGEEQDIIIPPSFPIFRPARASTEKNSIAFVFTGQGAQHAGMGLELMQYNAFGESLRKSNDILTSLGCEWSIFEELRNDENIHQPEFSQSLCTALQIALVDLLRTFDVEPAAVIGHSSGEIAAAYTIGAISHESACKVAYFRGKVATKLRTTTTPGAMLSVNLAETEVLKLLDMLGLGTGNQSIYVACFNSPSNITLSGYQDAIDTLKCYLDHEGIFAQKVNTGVAYHSPAMLAVASEYHTLMSNLAMSNAQRNAHKKAAPMVSSVTGGIIDPKLLLMPEYWVNNMISPVRFVDAIQHLKSLTPTLTLPLGAGNVTDLVEIGPHAALRRPIRDTPLSVRYHSTLERSKSPVQTTLALLGALFCHGHPVSILAANNQNYENVPFLVDCPSYPFDHSRRYWSESRLSKDYRFRAHTPGYLLGKRSIDWNAVQPRWRNWMCVETMPWLGDHVVKGSIICPGTGMLVMAIEAAKEAAAVKNRVISGFHFKKAHFIAPIIVGKTTQDATETELHLRPIQHPDEKESTLFEIHIYTHRDDRWMECFSANVEVQYEVAIIAVIAEMETDMAHKQIQVDVERAFASCANEIDYKEFYSFWKDHGIYYGESFRLLHGIRWDGHATSVARIDTESAARHYQATDSPVHPALLDATLHTMLLLASKGLSDTNTSTLVPQQLADTWFSAKLWNRSTSSLRLSSIAHRTTDNPTGIEYAAYALADDGSPVCVIQHLAMAETSQHDKSSEHDGAIRRLLHNIAWKPQLSSLRENELQKLCDTRSLDIDESAMVNFYLKIEFTMWVAARKALREVTFAELDPSRSYLRKLVACLEQQTAEKTAEGKSEGFSDLALESLLRECETDDPDWCLFTTVARALPSILRGETDTLETLFATNAAEKFYDRLFNDHMRDGRIQTFLELASHEKPDLKILEVGAGTGALTYHVLSVLQNLERQTGKTCFAEYTYTDISPSFFDNARTRFKVCQNRIHFKTLDLERDVLTQDFELYGYDLILAGSVLHATSNLAASLKNIRQLLKPKSHIMFLEITDLNSLCATVGFGCLEGWWLGTEPWRQHTPLITVQRWGTLLREAGFSGLDFVHKPYKSDTCQYSSVIVSTAVYPEQVTGTNGVSGHQRQFLLLVDPESDTQNVMAAEITRHHSNMQVVSLAYIAKRDTAASSDDVIISLLEVGAPYLATLSDMDFQVLQKLIYDAYNILWVTWSSFTHNSAADPHYSIAVGLLRSVSSEDSNKHIVLLAIESCAPRRGPDFVLDVLQSCFLSVPASCETDFVVRDEHLEIGRLVEEVELNIERTARIIPQMRNEPWQPGVRLALALGTPGILDTLQFIEDSATADLDPNEVEIEAAAWPVSFRDIFIALGRLGKEGLGFECAGNVTRVGANCPDFQPGNRVLMIVEGCMRSHPRAPAHAVFKIPNTVSFNDAVSAINPGMTAYHALVNIARLQAGDKILIHAAAGSTGQMAVGIAKSLGAEVFATIGSNDKKQLLIQKFCIPENHIFYSRNTDFSRGVLRVTKGYGVDVVLNSLSGKSLYASWDCIAPYGRFVEIGKADIRANSGLPMGRFAKNVSFAAIDLHHIVNTNSRLTRQLAEKILELVVQGDVSAPAPLHVYCVSDVEKAFRYMQSGRNTGRIIVTLSHTDVVPKVLLHKSTWQFDANASYVVAGGLGGLGREILRWMTNRGARNLIVLSRSGANSKVASEMISELTNKGVNIVALRCDISSTELLGTLEQCASIMPSIRGCINAAMVLNDTAFYNMTHAQWSQTVRSKVNASWNLHRVLPRNMDFFILLSSLSGIYGSSGQANYAAGCTFQDALARFRTANGLAGSVSLDLGWMRTIGIISESEDYRRHRERARDMSPIEAEDLLAILDHYCDPSMPALDVARSQLLVGVTTPAHFQAQGEAPPPTLKRPLFVGFNDLQLSSTGRISTEHTAQEDPTMLFRQASDPKIRSDIVVTALKSKLARALDVSTEEVDPGKTLSDYGTDSLMALELRGWFRKAFNADVAVFEIMGWTTITAVGELVAAKTVV